MLYHVIITLCYVMCVASCRAGLRDVLVFYVTILSPRSTHYVVGWMGNLAPACNSKGSLRELD